MSYSRWPRRRTERPSYATFDDPPDTIVRAHVHAVPSPAFGTEWRCDAGQPEEPVGCERHSQHHRCTTCSGWFGVPHDDIHSGPGKHPTWSSVRDCVCVPCGAERERRRSVANPARTRR